LEKSACIVVWKVAAERERSCPDDSGRPDVELPTTFQHRKRQKEEDTVDKLAHIDQTHASCGRSAVENSTHTWLSSALANSVIAVGACQVPCGNREDDQDR
jgi:hypothetical protein